MEFLSDPTIQYDAAGNLHCDAGTVSDQDGDALSFEYLWFIDSQSNAPIANGSTLELELDS